MDKYKEIKYIILAAILIASPPLQAGNNLCSQIDASHNAYESVLAGLVKNHFSFEETCIDAHAKCIKICDSSDSNDDQIIEECQFYHAKAGAYARESNPTNLWNVVQYCKSIMKLGNIS